MIRTFRLAQPRRALSSAFFFLTAILLSIIGARSVRAQFSGDAELLDRPILAPTDSGAYSELNRLPESLRRSAPFAREYYEFIRHAGTSGTVDPEAYLATW